MSNVRVRFAPSPTGFFHIGSARTALFNWLYARHTGGTFVLRVEDTDAARNTEEALAVLIEGMKWLGLDWDEGPDVGGNFGPYFQSQRGDVYQEYIQRLRDTDRAYDKDGAVWFRLEGERYTEYDEFHKAEIEKVRGDPFVIEDAVRGRVERREERDFVIVRANGQPVFHLVNVVDDIAMGITHVIRGEDHLSNTSKHVALFDAFGAPRPVFAHIPLILKQSGPGKMSKRDVGALVEDYQQRGYLAEAVRNFICLLGWSPKDDREILPINEIIELFDFSGINKGNARFDEKKLSSINAHYLRALPVETFAWLCRPVLTEKGVVADDVDEEYLQAVLGLCQEKATSVDGLPGFVAYFFTEDFLVDEKARSKVMKKGEPLNRLQEVREALATAEDFSTEALENVFNALAEQHDMKPHAWFPVTRLAVSGTNSGPAFFGLLAVLGKDRILSRMDAFLARENA